MHSSSLTPSRHSLHHSLINSLRSITTTSLHPRSFALTTLRSKPYRTYTLFPHALDPNLSILRTDFLIILAEQFIDYRPSRTTVPQSITLPVFALEASLYTIKSTAVELLYVSKIDTTGLAPLPAPAAILTVAFLAHFLQQRPKWSKSLRIHVFARAAREGQYLFPGSADNVPGGSGDGAPPPTTSPSTVPRLGKRLLDDQQLIRWWHKILSRLVIGQPLRRPLQAFYILPGFDYEESRAVLPVSADAQLAWTYGHPYDTITSPVATGPGPHALSELVPAFSDDPKARFLNSLGSCVTAPAGEPGDWDDAIHERAPAALEADRARERVRMNTVGPAEFWERMGGRQECCDGRVSAFFVLASTPLEQACLLPPPPTHSTKDDARSTCSNGSSNKTSTSEDPSKHLASVPRNVWVSLWSKFHNKDYSKLDAAAVGYATWISDVEACVLSELRDRGTVQGDSKELNWAESEYHSKVVVDNPIRSSDEHEIGLKKRLAEEPKVAQQVTVLQPRKKVKANS